MKYKIDIQRIYEVIKLEQVELEFDSLDKAEDWRHSQAFLDYIENLNFVDEEWEHRDIEVSITPQEG